MTTNKYRGHTITLTGSSTEITAYCYGKPYCKIVGLYRVEGKHAKSAGERPFLCSRAEAREWIAEQIDGP